MTASIERLGGAFRGNTLVAWLVVLGGMGGLVATVGLATRRGSLELVVGLVALGLVALIGFRRPLLILGLFVALIPIEEVVVIDGLGTVSRFAGILFALVYAAPRLGRLTLGAMPTAAWAYLAWALVSMTWALDAGTSWDHLVTLLQLFLIATLVASFVVERPAIVRPILWVYSVSASATALIGIQTYVASGLATTVRAAAIEHQNPAQFAAVLLPALFFGLYELLDGHRRTAGGAIALISAAGIVVSGTRGAWLAVAVVALFVILPQLRPRRRVAAVVAMVALVIAVYQIPGVPDLVADRAGNALSTGGAGRSNIWSVAGTMYERAPVLGVGYANFPVAYTPEVVRASSVTSYRLIEGLGPHNIVVGTLIELGPIGLLLLVLFLGPLVVRRGWGPDAATVQASLLSLLTLALFLDILANRKQIWLIIGLAAGLAYLARRRKADAVEVGDPAVPGAEVAAPSSALSGRLPSGLRRRSAKRV